MSSSDRRAVLSLLATLPLAACGFSPVYAPQAPARQMLSGIQTAAPSGKRAFDLVARLEERLGRPGPDAPFLLRYQISVRSEALAIRRANQTTRYRLHGTVSYRLIRQADRKAATRGQVSSFAAYSAAGTSVETAASNEDAETRLMRILADQLVTQLMATAPEWGGA